MLIISRLFLINVSNLGIKLHISLPGVGREKQMWDSRIPEGKNLALFVDFIGRPSHKNQNNIFSHEHFL